MEAIHDLPRREENPWHKCQRQRGCRNFVVLAVDEWHLAVLNGHDHSEYDSVIGGLVSGPLNIRRKLSLKDAKHLEGSPGAADAGEPGVAGAVTFSGHSAKQAR